MDAPLPLRFRTHLGLSYQLLTSHNCNSTRKRLYHYCVLSGSNVRVSTELFPGNGCCTVACLHTCYWVIGLRVTIRRNVNLYGGHLAQHRSLFFRKAAVLHPESRCLQIQTEVLPSHRQTVSYLSSHNTNTNAAQ
jgi:hypothetical protein